jgi:hypothetical protein
MGHEMDAVDDLSTPAGRSLLPSATAAWLIYLATDFLLHAVFLSPWWRATADYWLSPTQLFQFIPFAYASFALYCAALNWLLVRLYGPRPSIAQGLKFGASAGLIFGTTVILANYSVFPLPVSALLVWPVTVILESAAVGVVSAWVLSVPYPWRRAGVVFGIAVGLFVLGIIIQNVFFPGAVVF